MIVPDPQGVRAARLAAGLTQEEAAELAGLSGHARWAEYEAGIRTPAASTWELFLLKAGLHPTMRISKRKRP